MAGGGEVKGSCHCGAVRLSVPRAPEWVASCNCSLCTKTGWLVAYYPHDAVTVEGDGAVSGGDRMIGIPHCPICGRGMYWKTLGEDFRKMGMHARLLEGFDVGASEVRLVDGASW